MSDVVEFQLTKDEYWAFQLSQIQKSINILPITLICIGVLFLRVIDTVTGVAFIVAAFAMYALLRLLYRRMSRKQFRESPLFRSKHKITIDDDGYHFECESMVSTTRWILIETAILQSHLILIKTKGFNQFHTIPRRAFGSQESETVFVEQLKSFGVETKDQTSNAK